MGNRKRGRTNERWIDYIKEAIGHESIGAEQGCWGQGSVDITRSYGRQESELTQQHVTNTYHVNFSYILYV